MIKSLECDKNQDSADSLVCASPTNDYRSRWQKQAVITLISTLTLNLSSAAIAQNAIEKDQDLGIVTSSSASNLIILRSIC